MKKKNFMSNTMSRMLLIALFSFVCVSTSFAQESVTDKIANAKFLFSTSFSSLDDVQRSKIISFFENCSKPQQEAILSYMVQAITDSLRADNKEFAINYIDYYRHIADPDNEYLGSLVVTEGKYYYEKMDASKLSDIYSYLNDIAAKSKLDYSSEQAELDRMKNEIENIGNNMIGCWLMYNSNDKYGYPLEIINIYRNSNNQYSVSFEDPQLSNMMSSGGLGAAIMSAFSVPTKGVADTCYFTNPKELFYFHSSEKLRKGNETLASGLRSGVRSAGNSVIGHLARSENFSNQLFGWFGVIGAEGIFNSLIDGLAISKKHWILREGYVTSINECQMEIRYTYFTYKMKSNSTTLPAPQITNVNSVLYKYPDGCDIAFIDETKGLITNHPLNKMDTKKYYAEHPDTKKAKNSWKKRLLYNNAQWEKLKEYNRTH